MPEHVPGWLGRALAGMRAGADKLVIAGVALGEGSSIDLSSPAFADGARLPPRFTADGDGVSPPLVWGDPPAGTVRMALIVEDADAPAPQPLVHAIVWGIASEAGRLAEGAIVRDGDGGADGRDVGRHSFLGEGWRPPDPPTGHGEHRYAFQLFALSDGAGDPGATPGRADMVAAMAGHVLAAGLLLGTYSRGEPAKTGAVGEGGDGVIGTLMSLAAAAVDPAAGLQPPMTVTSAFVPARTVQVWLPAGYDRGGRRYPVIYMTDGQNVFDTPAALSGHSWQVHRTLAALIAAHRVRPAIVVAVWSNGNRIGEYLPEAALADASATVLDGLPVMRAQVAGDAYLRFLVGELKPMIDARYRTLPGRRDTFAMGSSMGGLIAAYAAARYPTVFGGFAGLSTAWQIGDGFTQRWYAAHLPPRSTRVYFDYGTGTNDAVIGPWQDRLTAAATAAGRHWLVRSWPGDAHTESAWAGRVGVPIQWLLGPR